MDIFGSFALLLAFLAAVYAFAAGIVAIVTRRPLLTKSARNSGMAVFGLITLAVGCLEYLFFTNDFSMAYVAAHSNRALPPFYKFAALWSGQEGSLLFWSWLLSIYAFFALFLYRKKHPELMPYAGVTLAGVQIFFLTLNNFVASPFKVLGGADSAGLVHVARLSEGSGLNPLLQYYEMVIHPPMLYLGYTGFTVPFAFALAALLGRYPGEKWIHITRRWTMVAWCFQTVGILLGAHWAYAVLGWGGYWAWDPVENASLLPWITGTAFLHSVMMQEKRGMMKVWNVWLVFITFMLCILGTMLTRSGVVSSVHAFAESSIGGWFVTFLGIVFVVCLAAWYKNRDYLRSDNQLDSLVSRESSFLFNNLVLLAACFAVLWGTLFPVLSEWVTGNKISVGPPFFNKVNIPIALFLLFLTGVGPLLAWRKTSFDALKRNFAWPLAAGLLAGAVAFAFGFREIYALICLILSVFVTLTIFFEFFRGARVIASRDGSNLLSAVGELTMRNTRRYGGYVVHFGMVLIFIGIAGQAFNKDIQKEMGAGDTLSIGPYTILCQNFDQVANDNYQSERATLEVFRGGHSVMMLYPEHRLYLASQVPETMVAIESSPLHDLYVVYAGRSPDTGKPSIHAYLNPLVKWIWFGGIVVVLGTGLALMPNRRTALVLRPAEQKSWGDAITPGDRQEQLALSSGGAIPMIDRLIGASIGQDARAVPDTEGCLIRLVGLFAAVVLCVALAAMLVIPMHAQQTDRAKMLGQKLFCACGCTQVLTACNHVGCTVSHGMLKEIDDRIARGDSDDLILQSFVQEYGLKVLTEPPNKGFNRFAVIAPVAAPIIALLILWEVVRRWRQRATLAGAGGPPISPELLARARSESNKGPGGYSDE